jgi:hypothetical protein
VLDLADGAFETENDLLGLCVGTSEIDMMVGIGDDRVKMWRGPE